MVSDLALGFDLEKEPFDLDFDIGIAVLSVSQDAVSLHAGFVPVSQISLGNLLSSDLDFGHDLDVQPIYFELDVEIVLAATSHDPRKGNKDRVTKMK